MLYFKFKSAMSLSNIPEVQIDLNDQLYDTSVPDVCEQMGGIDFMEKLLKEKKEKPSKFESHWEKDENEIDEWTDNDLKNDERKQLLVYAESSYDQVYELMNKNNRSIESKRELLTFQDDDGYAAITRAAYSNNLSALKYFLSFECTDELYDLKQLEIRTEMGWTALHSASYWNSHEIVFYILKHANGDVNVKTSGGQTPLHITAQKSDCMETILILLTHPSTNYRILNNQNETALEIANRQSKFNALFEIAEDNLNLI